MIFDDFLKTKKMRNVRTVILAAVSRRDLYYVSENKSFCFGQNKSVVYRAQSEVKNKKLVPISIRIICKTLLTQKRF